MKPIIVDTDPVHGSHAQEMIRIPVRNLELIIRANSILQSLFENPNANPSMDGIRIIQEAEAIIDQMREDRLI